MQNAEIELKFPISDLNAFNALLGPSGFHLDTPRTFEHNTLYDTPSRDLRARGQILRIRRYGDIWTVTHKRRFDPNERADSPRYKVRLETETTVADPDALAAIFSEMGYQPAFTYEKFRTEWSQPANSGSSVQAHLVIDETPIGNYAELEGPVSWIDRTIASLGIDPATCLTDSYGKLFLDWKQRTSSPAEDLTFEAVAAPPLNVP